MTYSHVLADDEQKELLRIARATVKEFLLSGRMPPGAPHRPSLVAPAAVFVSYHEDARDGEIGADAAKKDELRGCIGTTLESTPLYRSVQEMAVAAASRDPRYPPIRLDELPRMNIEVSVLGDRAEVRAPDEIQIGVHGLMVMRRGPGGQRGLLLPKVATEQGWSAEQLFAHTCEKAGLPEDFWRREEAHIERFTAQVFDEKSLATGPFAPPKA
jgi:AmmeMemoRadiSam system protein A